jgi:GH24 family phage-related lysozyme (muramidase)
MNNYAKMLYRSFFTDGDIANPFEDTTDIDTTEILPSDLSREERIQRFQKMREPTKQIMVDPVSKELEFEKQQRNKVDFDFIKAQEGFETQSYVPKDKEGNVLGKSGVTVASGYDLGQKSLSDLEGLSESLIEKLAPYLGVKGKQADAIANNLILTKAEADIINQFSKEKELEKISKKWKDATGTEFSELDGNKQTVIASVAFQYGSNLDKATPNFWKQVTSGDWKGAKENLLDFGDAYSSRRKREASLI